MAPPDDDWPRVIAGDHLQIWENPNVLPRAFAPDAIEVVPSARAPGRVPMAMAAAEDFSRLAWLESDELTEGRRDNGSARIDIRADGPDLWLDIEADEASWIVVSNVFWSGYRAVDQDGKRLRALPANHAFMGFEVAPGSHRVRVFYRPQTWGVSWALWWLGVAIPLGLGIRRHRSAAEAAG